MFKGACKSQLGKTSAPIATAAKSSATGPPEAPIMHRAGTRLGLPDAAGSAAAARVCTAPPQPQAERVLCAIMRRTKHTTACPQHGALCRRRPPQRLQLWPTFLGRHSDPAGQDRQQRRQQRRRWRMRSSVTIGMFFVGQAVERCAAAPGLNLFV